MNKKYLSGSSIKIIAMTAMVVDHFGFIILKNVFIMNTNYEFFSDKQFNILLSLVDICNIIGRLAFPLFCFLVVEGFYHTKNLKRYIKNLLLFALVTEPIYDWTLTDKWINFHAQNVLFTLSLGLITLVLIKKSEKNYLLITLIIFLSSLISYVLKLDGWYYGIFLMSSFYLFRNKHFFKYIAAAIIMFVCGLNFSLDGLLDPYFGVSLLTLPIIYFYNGQRGLTLKYVFYPIHLVVLKIISMTFLSYTVG